MDIGPIPEHLKAAFRDRYLSGLKGDRSLDHIELDLFRWFMRETEEAWAQMEAEEQQFIQDQLVKGADEINDSGLIASHYYGKRTRYSHVIFLASLLEGAMKHECQRLSNALGDAVLFKPAELKGDAWGARRLFLERHARFTTPDALWLPIAGLLEVRNALVHHNGEHSLLTAQQVGALKKLKGIDLTGSDLRIASDYLERAANAVGELMDHLHMQTNAAIDRLAAALEQPSANAPS
jgi:hypothetical protein